MNPSEILLSSEALPQTDQFYGRSFERGHFLLTRREAPCAPTSRRRAHSRTGGFPAPEVARTAMIGFYSALSQGM